MPPTRQRSLLSSLFSIKGRRRLASTTAMKMALAFCPGFAEAVANIAIYCKQRFAACNPRAVNENRRHVGK
jgi:hypothetical protein